MCSELGLNVRLLSPNSEVFPSLRKDSAQRDERGRLLCRLDWHRPSHPGVCRGKVEAREMQANTFREDVHMSPVLPRTTDGFSVKCVMYVHFIP